MTNTAPDFYKLMGPFLSRRDIVAELGFALWDDDNKVWFIAFDGERVVGFAALRIEGQSGTLCSAYVLPDYRRRGIYGRLITERIQYAGQQGMGTLKATATESSARALQEAGFVLLRPVGRYVRMEMAL
jgi:GNAT superfamily N-acetyltransferase